MENKNKFKIADGRLYVQPNKEANHLDLVHEIIIKPFSFRETLSDGPNSPARLINSTGQSALWCLKKIGYYLEMKIKSNSDIRKWDFVKFDYKDLSELDRQILANFFSSLILEEGD